jgi:hypothetical protein
MRRRPLVASVRVLVMDVVHVPMLVLHGLVPMRVSVLLGEG